MVDQAECCTGRTGMMGALDCAKKKDEIKEPSTTTHPLMQAVMCPTYTSLSLSSEGSFFFFSFALARSFSFL